MKKITTACCALCQLAEVTNVTEIEEIEDALEQLKHECLINTEVGITTGNGQTAVFVIVSPGEVILKSNLKKLKFKEIHQFKRRIGYPDVGDLKMYIKNLI
jgi:hypothetical protein